MESNTTKNNGNRYQRIINVLLLNTSFIDNLGLMHGKIGIAIYFFHLARETKNEIYEDYASELIDEIYDEISDTTPLDFENGLAGIGWGIEYLVQSGFIEADTDEVLEDFDKRLQPSRNQFQSIGILKGLTGLGAYYLKRIQNPAASDEKIPTLVNKQMLIHIIDELELRIENEGVIKLINGTETFTLTWDYLVLLVFLAEVFQLNLFNFKVDRILHKLIEPIFETENMPRQHSKRLLLAVAFEKIKYYKIGSLQNGSIDKLMQNMLTKIDRETICKELTPNSAFMQNGTSGIEWIYKQLLQLTGKEYYQKEVTYWNNCTLEFDETDQGYAGFNVSKENEDKSFGLLTGLAGITFLMPEIKF